MEAPTGEPFQVIAVSYHDRVNVLQAPGFASTGPFDRPEWFALLESEGGLQPLVVIAQDGEHAAALPLMHQGKALVPMTNWYSFTWQPLFTPGANRLPLLTAIARDLAAKAKRITLSPLPDEDDSANVLGEAFRASGWTVLSETCDSNHILWIAGRSYEEYLASRPGPLRTTLKRKAKKIDVELHTAFDSKAWHDYEAVYSESWKPAEGKPAMLRHFAEQEGAAGRLRLAIARHQGRAIAAQFWTVEERTAYIHKLAHTNEAVPLSAGTVLTAALFEQVIDRDGVNLVDFGTGDDPYKGSWMEEMRPRYRLDCHRPANPASWPYLVRAGLRKLASTRSSG